MGQRDNNKKVDLCTPSNLALNYVKQTQNDRTENKIKLKVIDFDTCE